MQEPLLLFAIPFFYAANSCFNEYLQNRLQIHDDINEAEKYIAARAQLNLILLSFANFQRNLLAEAFAARNRQPVYHALDRMHYYSPGSPPRLIYQRNRGDDYDLDAALEASRLEAEARRPKPLRNVGFQPANDVPANFKVAEDKFAELERGVMFDPIDAEEINLDGEESIACVPVNGVYQLYKKDYLTHHIETQGSVGGGKLRYFYQ